MQELATTDPRAEEAVRAEREVEAAIRASNMPLAAGLAESALARGLERSMFYTLRAMRLETQGQTAEALADLDKAQALDPRDFMVPNARGQCLMRLDRNREAVDAFEASAALEPRFAAAHLGRGAALEALGDLPAARQAYEMAVAKSPDLAPALARLAIMAARRREPGEARAWGQRALAADSSQTSASAALAMADILDGAFDKARARLEGLLTNPLLEPADRAAAHGLLGDALDGQGLSAEAFAAYAEGNRLLVKIHASRYAAPGVQSARAAVGWLAYYFKKSPAVRWAATSNTGAFEDAGASSHVFLVGFPRSGTTLLEQILASHPGIVSLEEHETLTESAAEFMGGPEGLDRLSSLTRIDLAPYRRAYWDRVRQGGVEVNGKVFVDKLPLNILKLPLVARLFPKAKVLLALRDPRDVVLSCFRRRFRMNASMYELLTLEGAAGFYDAAMGLAELYREKLQLEHRAIRYEDLVADFEGQAKALCAWFGVEFDPAMHGFAERARQGLIATPSSTQVAEGLYTRGVGQWRAYRDQMAPVLPVLEPWVRQFGYTAD
jgi:tetratricopeptide (TPR) repeat protein